MNRSVTPVELTVGCNEASDLLPVHSPELLAAYGARRGFWTVLDEGPVEECVALLVEGQDGQWHAHHLRADAGVENGRTEDGEALAYHDGWIYVIGSHFGSKAGPLRPRRAFFARFRETDAVGQAGAVQDATAEPARAEPVRIEPVRMEVVRNQFRLHRVLNDALNAAALDPLNPGERIRHRFILRTRDRGTARAKGWATRLAETDLPVNVEAAAFTPDGTLLLGLRFPVSVQGEPVLVEVTGASSMFEAPGSATAGRRWPRAVGVHRLTGVTPAGALTGFRALSARPDGDYDAVVGSIDALGKGSVLLDDHPEGGEVTCRHVRFRLPNSGGPAGGAAGGGATANGGAAGGGATANGGAAGGDIAAGGGTGAGAGADRGGPGGANGAGQAGTIDHVVPAVVIAELAPFHNVEGVCELDGERYYVTDEDHRVAIWKS